MGIDVTAVAIVFPHDDRGPFAVGDDSRGDFTSLRSAPPRGRGCYGGGKGWSRFPTQDPIDFPRLPEFKAEATLTLEGEALSRLLSRTAYAAAVEEMRQMLQGVLVQSADGRVTFVATDGLAPTTAQAPSWDSSEGLTALGC